jgi:hypothetical protein
MRDLPLFDCPNVVSQGHPHYSAMMSAADRQDYLSNNFVFSYNGTLYKLSGDGFPGCKFFRMVTRSPMTPPKGFTEREHWLCAAAAGETSGPEYERIKALALKAVPLETNDGR